MQFNKHADIIAQSGCIFNATACKFYKKETLYRTDTDDVLLLFAPITNIVIYITLFILNTINALIDLKQ